jgi:hypothetical protein
MDTVLASHSFTPLQIRRINYCRLYLQVITVSDISDAHGNQLAPELYYGRLNDHQGKTTWHSFKIRIAQLHCLGERGTRPVTSSPVPWDNFTSP